MFRNLEAEQRRKGMTNQQVAEILGVTRRTYEKKKKHGDFGRTQIMILLDLFGGGFDYLFAEEGDDLDDTA